MLLPRDSSSLVEAISSSLVRELINISAVLKGLIRGQMQAFTPCSNYHFFFCCVHFGVWYHYSSSHSILKAWGPSFSLMCVPLFKQAPNPAHFTFKIVGISVVSKTCGWAPWGDREPELPGRSAWFRHCLCFLVPQCCRLHSGWVVVMQTWCMVTTQ